MDSNISISEKKMSVKTITTVGMFTAVVCILSVLQIPLPTGVPVVLQTFAVALTGYVLGEKKGTLAVLLYVLLGAVGLPVFAGMSGGFEVIIGKTGGFIYGYIVYAFMCGIGSRFKNIVIQYLLGAVGMAICYICGVVQFKFVMGLSWALSFSYAAAPFIIKDLIFLALALFAAMAIKKGLRKANLL